MSNTVLPSRVTAARRNVFSSPAVSAAGLGASGVEGREAGLSAPRGTRSSICASDAFRTGVACWAPDDAENATKYNAMTPMTQIVFIFSFLGDFEAEAVFIGRIENRNENKSKG
ncbi:MAG: hypothetical protein JJ959_10445 [Nisaea sp.]|uniref:hypothetical protein n=1 Tax=Nisaea sp. TaxID=2024842 RepID=UPI001B059577|nr:hypothetical protein [Nisaea sp.]MBO6560949.1 hypothetical protein [Nisaea sp.]